jgi:hypothetical protein
MKRRSQLCLPDSSECVQTFAEVMPEPTMAEFLSNPKFLPPPNIGQNEIEPILETLARQRKFCANALESWHFILDSPELTDEMAEHAHDHLDHYFERKRYCDKLLALAESVGQIVTVEDHDGTAMEVFEPWPKILFPEMNSELALKCAGEASAEWPGRVEMESDKSPDELESAIVLDLLTETDMSDFDWF